MASYTEDCVPMSRLTLADRVTDLEKRIGMLFDTANSQSNTVDIHTDDLQRLKEEVGIK